MSAAPIIADELHIERHRLPTGQKVTNVYATSSDFVDGATDAPDAGIVWEVTRTEAPVGEMIATGQLLFAAGDMLAALKWAERGHDEDCSISMGHDCLCGMNQSITAAIAKAGGAS